MPHRLLLADDSITIQKVIELTFADEGVSVVAVGDGEQAIARLTDESFDIVLADIDMPGRDGFEVAAFVHNRSQSAHVPVILLTGAFEPVDQERVKAVGAAAVLAKPFEPQVLVAKVRELLNRTPGEHAAPQISSVDALLSAPASSRTEPPSVDDYFERLDRAFANLNAPLEPKESMRSILGQPPTAPGTPPRPAPSGASALATSMDTSDGATQGDTHPPEGSLPHPQATAVRDGAASTLASSFATVLAVEQGELPQSALLPPPSDADNDLVERIARRVIEHMGDQTVRDLARDIVSRTAERLVREEIERIKTSIG
jgi:CheY-like chemotaxis protein